jgi:hypothetical protein
MRSPSPDEPDEPDPPWWRYAVRPLLEVLHEPHVDVGDEPLPEMEIGEPDPAFLDSQDIDENDMLECRDSSYQDHDEDSGDDDYGEEEERLTLEDMLYAPKMFHNVDNFHMGPEPHQRQASQLSDGGVHAMPTGDGGENALGAAQTEVGEAPCEA